MNGNVIQNKATIHLVGHKQPIILLNHTVDKKEIRNRSRVKSYRQTSFLDYQWLPEEIEGRLCLERGKTRYTKVHMEKRGKLPISRTIHERPTEANEHSRIGDWEADTVVGQTGKACLVILTNQYSCFLKIQKVAVKKSQLVTESTVKVLEPLAKEIVTPDRGVAKLNSSENK